ncbi:MAG TPA: ABC transporter permease subunit, partial [Pyrinomonadaceae bacterium]
MTGEFALTTAARGGSAFANFAAVFRAELLFNRRRVAPYVMAALFSANALLWWGWGAAVYYGWAVNSDYYIVRCLTGFCFMTTPFFVALLMADPVVRDYRTGVDPLIFSKPLSRAEYLLGKFVGNYLVLLACQSCFALTLLALQGFTRGGMIAQPARLTPYCKHFLFFVAAPSLLLAAVCFAVGTLSRSVRLVYGLVTSLYVLYMGLQVAARGLPRRWRVLPDPLLMNVYPGNPRAHSADYFNSLAVGYDADMLFNRALLLLATLACLASLYARFSTTERRQTRAARDSVTTLDLADDADWLSGAASETVSPRAAGGSMEA